MSREGAMEELYQGLSVLVRRSRELSQAVHPSLSLAAYSVLDQIASRPGTRSADLASISPLVAGQRPYSLSVASASLLL